MARVKKEGSVIKTKPKPRPGPEVTFNNSAKKYCIKDVFVHIFYMASCDFNRKQRNRK